MPRLTDGASDALYTAERAVTSRFAHAWDGFTDFVFRDNVLEVALGLIIAAAFTKVVSSFVTDIILPIFSMLPFLSSNFEQIFAVLRRGKDCHRGCDYNTLQQALDDGAVVMAYGLFFNNLLNLLGLGLALYMIGVTYGWATGDKVIKRQVKCKYCRKWISEKAKRCVNCTSWLDGRED